MTTDVGLTADKAGLSGAEPVVSRQTSPTNIGCGLWSAVAAAGLGVTGESAMTRSLSPSTRA
ncbi:hypothetical protein WQ59_13470 [Streptomyces sp. KE1]|nr:hypothetical protein WQ59_13470 [Streptomyces sp. KE1]